MMGMSLNWRPKHPKPQGNYLDDKLKFLLRKEYTNPVDLIFDSKNIEFLEGLRCAGIKGAAELIAAIRQHETIELFEE